MIQDLEIGGTNYKLVANRNVSTMLEKCVEVDKDGNAKINMPDKAILFYALLKKEQPEISQLEAEKILEIADGEYGVAQMNSAIDKMVNSVFTQGSNMSHKKIAWVEEN